MTHPASPKKMFYLARSTWWMKLLSPRFVWSVKTSEKKIYLTFDDGPHPEATPFVLDELKKYNAKASFFCVGSNVLRHPELYQRLLDEGHSTGNHTHTHPNGWNTPSRSYLEDVKKAAGCIESTLFRPPYGRIKRAQRKNLAEAMGIREARVVMWSILSTDFDPRREPEECFELVKKYAKKGSIVVFHDSQKGFRNLSVALPLTLKYFSEQGYLFEKL